MASSNVRWVGPVSAGRLKTFGLTPVPEAGGVYLWMRSLDLDPECAVDGRQFSATIERLLSVPFARLDQLQFSPSESAPQVTVRPGLVAVAGLTIGGGRLSTAKKSHLRDIADRDPDRMHLYLLLRETVARFGPILYVGETANLRQRAAAHVTSKTDLLRRADHLGISSNDLLLYCLPLPQFDRATRTLVEQILTHILVAPFTKRPG